MSNNKGTFRGVLLTLLLIWFAHRNMFNTFLINAAQLTHLPPAS